MAELDVLLIHPPAIYDFRKKTLFPGALSTVDRIQYTKVSIGVLSIADYLDRNGYKVIVDNLADRMVSDKTFDAEEHIKKTSARIYAVGLHWHHHSQGAIEVARLCKQLHPDSLVVMGGLTSTYFHEEIIQKYEFIDAVIRGEAEKPFLEFLKAFDQYGKITDTPNLTYRADDGKVSVTPLMKPSENLDEFEFTRLDLLEPKTSIFSSGTVPHWSLVVCRGCSYNCTVCGASAYSYKKYLGMCKPAFRSPEKIVSDIKKLSKQGIKQVGLYQDPRMGGREYWKELMLALRRENLGIERLTLDILRPADEEFIREVATLGVETILYICPDSGCEKIREKLGRRYSNEELLNTLKTCYRYHVPVQIFFSVGLAGETDETFKETLELWDEISVLNKMAVNRGGFGKIGGNIVRDGPIMGPILLDPGSMAYDTPDKYGYKLAFKNLEEYIEALSLPSWHQWVNYGTESLDRDEIIALDHESVVQFIDKREKQGAYQGNQSILEYSIAEAEKVAAGEVDKIMKIDDGREREARLESLRSAIDFLTRQTSNDGDPYGYQEMIARRIIAVINSKNPAMLDKKTVLNASK
jgi:B12-binding domain/radical SAM domain protein